VDELKRKIAAAENMAVRQRNYRRARDRALARLAQKYKGEYLDYLAEEKAKDEQEGKRWHYHSNSDADLWSLITRSSDKSGGNTSTNSAQESDDK
jgi:hypothetical protein